MKNSQKPMEHLTNSAIKSQNTEQSIARDDTRTRIVTSAIHLLNSGGRDAVTTRAVADAAGVQPPAIYRLFHDKQALLDAVAEHGFTTYLSEKAHHTPSQDPVEDLRTGWDLHVAFGLARPAIYLLMDAEPRAGVQSPAAAAGYRILKEKIRRVAMAGRLRVSEEQAADLIHASACGTVLTLLSKTDECRDMGLSKNAREATIAAITNDALAFETSGIVAAAVALRAVLPRHGAQPLSEAENHLLTEWLDRLATSQD